MSKSLLASGGANSSTDTLALTARSSVPESSTVSTEALPTGEPDVHLMELDELLGDLENPELASLRNLLNSC